MLRQPRQSVLIDTSFLITLFDNSRPNHEVAKKYYKYFIDNNIDMYLSAIVASEYEYKDSIDPILDTGNFIPLPFNLDDSKLAGSFASRLHSESRGKHASRDSAKDDVKLLAQCSNHSIDFVATDDTSTMAKYCRRLNTMDESRTKVITLDCFDVSDFNGGQTELDINF